VAVDSGAAAIQQARVVLNGVGSTGRTPQWMEMTIQHELGHFLGLTHSQLNRHVEFDGDAEDDDLAPVMSYGRGPNCGPALHLDDRAWLAALYAKADAAPGTGTIRGRVLLPDGQTGLQGVQVVARRKEDEEITAVSSLSGFRFKEGRYGARDTTLQGYYELPGLPPGSYRLSIEPLEESPFVRPRHGFLPGGRRFWRDGLPLAVEARDASLVPVAAGSLVEGRDFVLDGAFTAPVETAEVESNDSPESARTVPLTALINGRAGPSAGGLWGFTVGGQYDAVEDWYRVVLTEPTLLSATLTAQTAGADLDLYLVGDMRGDVPENSVLQARSTDYGTPPEILQQRLGPGVYFLGVSSFDKEGNPESDYRLQIVGIPAPDPPAASRPPRITLATVSDLTPTGLRVRWQTDQDANGFLYLSSPQREIGSRALGRDHLLEVSGLTPGQYYRFELFSRGAGGEVGSLADLWVRTPTDPSGDAPYVTAGLWSAAPLPEKEPGLLLLARIYNRGSGTASGVRVNRLLLAPGWRFETPPSLPLELGSIGPNAAAIVIARVVPTETGPAPLELVIDGTYAGPDGTDRDFDH
jgi:hypothetical protein